MSDPIPSTTELVPTDDGREQLRRRWLVDAPRAAMLLVHGIGEHTGRYEHVGAAFAAVGIDVIAHDQRGFGRTTGPRGHVDSFDHYLDDVEILLAERRTHDVPVILMGHSLGGLISTTYLVSDRRQPDLAVLSAPALAAELPGWQRAIAPIAGAIAPKLKIPADFDGSVLSRDEEVQQAYENDPLRVPSSTARLGREILSAMSATGASLRRLRVPTYVLHGSDDTLVPPSASAPLGELPGVERKLWPGLRHEALNEPEKDDVIAEIISWLDRQLATDDAS
ncbi:MAG: lysophospholipase [Actinomycetota bacterium]